MSEGAEGREVAALDAFDPLGPFVVIGATGFLGAELTRQLCQYTPSWLPGRRHPRVVVIARNATLNPNLSGLDFQLHVAPEITRDVLERVRETLCGGSVAGIFHVAGLVKHTSCPADIAAMRRANVELTKIVLEFAAIHGIRTVYASSSGVVGCQLQQSKHFIAHDDAAFAAEAVRGLPYYEQKVEIEKQWRPRAAHGAPIIFLRPSLLLGPGDERLSSTRVVLQLLRNELPFKVAGGVSWIDVRDAAAAFIEAMVRTATIPPGTVMNLTTENVSFDEFARLIARVGGCRVPFFTLPPSLAVSGARCLTAINSVLRRPRDEGLDPVYAEVGNRFWNVSCQRALELLSFEPRDPQTTISDTVIYLNSVFTASPAAKQKHTHGRQRLIRIAVALLLLLMLWWIVSV